MSRRPSATILLLLLVAASAGASERPAPAVIVKLRGDGPAAVTECAESAWRAGRPLAGATADGSDSLDTLQRQLSPRSVRALFRRPDGRPFALQRERWQGALRARRARAPAAPAGAALPDLSHVYRVELAAEQDAPGAAALYRADAHVVWAQPEHEMEPDFVADDPFLFSSGSWGQPYADLWGLASVRAPEAWAYTRGEGAVIAVVDSGIDFAHPDMSDNVWVNPGEDLDGDGRASDADRNGVDDDRNGFVDDLTGWDFLGPGDADPFDDNGHGTHVAGTAAAVGGNGLGVIGVAPRARVMALKGFPASGSGLDTVLALAIVYAAANGADVINNSWSCSLRCPTNFLIDEAVAVAHALGTVVVTSAGNTGDDILFQSPKNRRETIAVAATREDDSIAPFSSRGLLVDLSAPGAGRDELPDPFARNAILSLLSRGAPGGFSERLRVGGDYVRLAGTSMSAPHVAGVVALVRSLQPDATPEEIRARLRATARDAGPPGHDPGYGAGIVDALAAVTGSAPRVRGLIAEPRVGSILDARSGPLAIRGSADGGDFASYALAYGRGLEPVAWVPIPAPASGPVTDALLGSWDLDALPDGPYVLRLEVESRSGERVHEFAPLSLERSRPFAVSPADTPARTPDVSGRLVTFAADWPVAGAAATGLDLFAADLRSSRVLTLARAPGTQELPRISGRRVAYRDLGSEPGGEIRSCVVDAEITRCDPLPIAVGPGQRSAPVVSGSRIYWTERDGAGESPRLCDLSRGATSCAPRPVAVRPHDQVELEVAGRRLVWLERTPVFSVWTCRLNPKSGACPAQLVDGDDFFQSAPVTSGSLFAWEQFAAWPGVGFGYRVNVCRLDPTSGSCAPGFAGTPSPSVPAPDVAGDTVVWSADAPGEPPAIWFCEHDAFSNACPAQRLAGSAAGARNPAIDGRQVVFEDERDGPTRIYATLLPDLVVRGERSVRVGKWLRLEIEARDPEGARVELSARLADGTPVEQLGIRFEQIRKREARLNWRPGPGATGRYVVRFEGATQGGLITRETLEIRVEDARLR